MIFTRAFIVLDIKRLVEVCILMRFIRISKLLVVQDHLLNGMNGEVLKEH